MKLEALAIKEQDKPFRVVNSDLFRGECDNLSPGRYRITVEKKRKNKSNPQLGYYYACVLPMFLRAAIDAGWELTTIDECDAWIKSMFGNKDLINKHTGQIVPVPGLKRDMSTVELSTMTNQARDYCAEYLGVYIPDPETNMQIDFT